MAGQSIFRSLGWINPNSKVYMINKLNCVKFTVPCMGINEEAKMSKQKIPEKPKRPLTAFFRFLAEKRSIVAKANPSLGHTDVVKTLAEQWSQLSAESKEKYVKAALEEKEKYDDAVVRFNAQLTPEQEDILKELKAAKHKEKMKRKTRMENKVEGKPKRPPTPFALFLKENFVHQKSLADSMRVVKEKWAKLSETEKEKYQLCWLRNKKQYEADLINWENQMIAKGKLSLVRVSMLRNDDENKSKSKHAGKTSKKD